MVCGQGAFFRSSAASLQLMPARTPHFSANALARLMSPRAYMSCPSPIHAVAVATAAIASVSGRGLDPARWRQRPYRAPHHTASAVALVGGGAQPRPGEISLAHNGVLFMDELPEWSRAALEADANLLVLAGDSHNAWAFDHRFGKDRIGVEMAGQSVTSPGFEHYVGWVRPDALARDWFTAERRHAGDASGRRLLRALLNRLVAVSRLHDEASGLMVFTQNPGVARRITDRQSPLEQEWLADVVDAPGDPEAREAVLRSIGKPLYFDGRELPRLKASWQSDRRLRMAFKHDMPAEPGHRIARAGLVAVLHRQRVGRIGLDGMVAGQWRCLGAAERF
mgnify:CR=1 FL=1